MRTNHNLGVAVAGRRFRAVGITLLLMAALGEASAQSTRQIVPPSNETQRSAPRSITETKSAATGSVQPAEWRPMSGSATAIGANAEGEVWVISNTPRLGPRTFRLQNGTWHDAGGTGVRIAVGPAGNAWVVQANGAIAHFTGAAWESVSGSAMDIAVGANGAIWIIEPDQSIARGVAGQAVAASPKPQPRGKETAARTAPVATLQYRWEKVPGAAVRIAVDPQGNPWVVNAAGQVYHYAASGWVLFPVSARDVAVGPDGVVYLVGTNPSAVGEFPVLRSEGAAWVNDGVMGLAIAAGPAGVAYAIKGTANGGALAERVPNRQTAGLAPVLPAPTTAAAAPSAGASGGPVTGVRGFGERQPATSAPASPATTAPAPTAVGTSVSAQTGSVAAPSASTPGAGGSGGPHTHAGVRGIGGTQPAPPTAAKSAGTSQPSPSTPAATSQPSPTTVSATCAAGYQLDADGKTCGQQCPPNFKDPGDNSCGRTLTTYQANGNACKEGFVPWSTTGYCKQACPPGMQENGLVCWKNCYPAGGQVSGATTCTPKAGSLALAPAGIAAPAPPPQTGASLGPVTNLPPPPGGGGANDIGANAKGDVWIISTQSVAGGYAIYRLVNGAWKNVPGGAVRISVDADGTAWAVNNSTNIFHSDNSGNWTTQPGGATDIAVGANGNLWIIGSDGGADHSIYQATFTPGTRNVANWQKTPSGAAVRIAISPDGSPWVVNSAGAAFHYQGNTWSQVTAVGGVKDVSVGPDGTPFVVNSSTLLSLWLNSQTLPGQSPAWQPKIFSAPPATNVAAGAAGAVYVTQDSSHQNAILSLGGLPIMPPPSPAVASNSATSSSSQGPTIAAGFNYCWRDSYGRGAGQPLSMNSSDCPGGTVKDPHGLLCYPPCQAGYDMVGPLCWRKCPAGFSDNGAFCGKPSSASYDRSSRKTYAWVGGDAPFDSSGQFKRCQAENPQGCEQIPPGLINLVYPKCTSGYTKRGSDNFICDSAAASCPAGMQDWGLSCAKNTYGNTAGQTLGCAPGSQQSGLLCYPQCKSGYHAVGPVCYADCPANWVQCGAGCAKDNSSCGANTAQQVLSVVQAAVQIAVTVATMGAATPGIDAVRQGEGDFIAEEFAHDVNDPGGNTKPPDTTINSEPEPSPNPTTPSTSNPPGSNQGWMGRIFDQGAAKEPLTNPSAAENELSSGLDHILNEGAPATSAETQEESQIVKQFDAVINDTKNGGADADQLIKEKSELDGSFDTLGQNVKGTNAPETIQLSMAKAETDLLVDGAITRTLEQNAAKESLTNISFEEKELSSEIDQVIQKDGGAARSLENESQEIKTGIDRITKDSQSSGVSNDQLFLEKTKIDSEFDKFIKDDQNARGSSTADSVYSEKNEIDTQFQDTFKKIDEGGTTNDLGAEEKQLSSARDQIISKNDKLYTKLDEANQFYKKLKISGASKDQLNAEQNQIDSEFDQYIKDSQNGGGSTAADNLSSEKNEIDALFQDTFKKIDQGGTTNDLGGEETQLSSALDQINTKYGKLYSILKEENQFFKDLKISGTSKDQLYNEENEIESEVDNLAKDDSNGGTTTDSLITEKTKIDAEIQELIDESDKGGTTTAPNTTAGATADLQSAESRLSSEVEIDYNLYNNANRAKALKEMMDYLKQMENEHPELFNTDQLSAEESKLDHNFDALDQYLKANKVPIRSQLAAAKSEVDLKFQAMATAIFEQAAAGAQQAGNSGGSGGTANQGGLTPAQMTELSQMMKNMNLQNMTPAQQQAAIAAAVQQVGSLSLAQGCTALSTLSTQQLQQVFQVALSSQNAKTNTNTNGTVIQAVYATPNNNSSTPMAPPSLSSLLPIQDVVNKITAANACNSGLTTDQRNMQIAMASLEGAAALDPTGVTGIIAAYTKPLCSLVMQAAVDNTPVVDLDKADREQMMSAVMGTQ